MKQPAPPERSPYPTRSQTAPVARGNSSKETEESTSRQRDLKNKGSAAPGKPGLSTPAGEQGPGKAGKTDASTKGKPTQKAALGLLEVILRDSGFKYTSLARSFVFPWDRTHVDHNQRLLQTAAHAIFAKSGIKYASSPQLMRKSRGKSLDGRAVGSAILARRHARFTIKKRRLGDQKVRNHRFTEHASAYYISRRGHFSAIRHAFSVRC